MYKTILLKTQLFEAAKLGRSTDYRRRRLAVILLDNFIEIQLKSLIDPRIRLDDMFGHIGAPHEKYGAKEKFKISRYHQSLLEACEKENILTGDEALMIEFCHEIRNDIYHEMKEERLLIDGALIMLEEIIRSKQPNWLNALGITSYRGGKEDVDPFRDKRKKGSRNGSSADDWEHFLKKYFKFIDKRKKGFPKTLSIYLLDKISSCNENIDFLEENAPEKFPSDKFNQWQPVKKSDLKKISTLSRKIAKQKSFEALATYSGLRKELDTIHAALNRAAIKLDLELQLQLDILRGK